MGLRGSKLKFTGVMLLATVVAGSMLTQTALATDNGGNGEGKLDVYSSQTDLSTPVTTLQWGHTYYIELENPGTHSQLWNEYNAPVQVNFHFFNPTRTFQGDPGQWDTTNPTFTVTGNEVDGATNSAPFVYAIQLPASQTDGDYTIEAGEVTMHYNNGEDEMYFSNDPQIGGLSIVTPGPAGQVPEVPYAGIIPLVLLAGAGLWYTRRRKQMN